MKNYKWNTEKHTDEIYIVLFTSRSKDNKDIEDFTQRREAFLTSRAMDDPVLLENFAYFARKGVVGETSRMYYSVNARNPQKINKTLVHYLIDNPDINPAAIQGRLAAIAAQKECVATKHWMFDFDLPDPAKAEEFKQDILTIDKDIEVTIHPTKNNFAIVTNRGFDTRTLLKKWKDVVSLKKDDLLYVTSRKKGWYINDNI